MKPEAMIDEPDRIPPGRTWTAIALWLFQLVFPTIGVVFVLKRVVNQRALGRYSLTLLGLCLAWYVACLFVLTLSRVRRRLPGWSAPLLFNYLCLFTFLLGVEFVIRARYLAEWNGMTLRPRMEYSRELGWKLAPGEFDVGERGWRVPDRAPDKRPGSFRIVCIGDSTTFGWNCPWNGAWPHQLEVLLNQDPQWVRTRGVTEVINLGVPGYGPDQALVVLQKYGTAYKPDMVIYHMCMNDFADASFDYDWRMPDGVTRYKPCYALAGGRLTVRRDHAPLARDSAGRVYRPGSKRSFGLSSASAMWLNVRLDRRESGLFFLHQNSWPVHERFASEYAAARPLVWALVREMAKTSRDVGSDFLVTLSPALMNAPSDRPPWRVGSFLREYERDAADSEVTSRHCVREYFDRGGDETFLTHGGAQHLNSRGNLLIAEATRRWLKESTRDGPSGARTFAGSHP